MTNAQTLELIRHLSEAALETNSDIVRDWLLSRIFELSRA